MATIGPVLPPWLDNVPYGSSHRIARYHVVGVKEGQIPMLKRQVKHDPVEGSDLIV